MIRKLDPSDLAGLTWIESLTSAAFHWSHQQVMDLSSSHEFWGLCEGEQVLACVAVIRLPAAFEIPLLATHPKHQRRGWMRQLLQQILVAKGHECEFWLEVHEANVPARALYQDLGFEVVGRRPRYYSDGAAALMLTRK